MIVGNNTYEPVEILLVEDNPQDAEITLRALKRANFANHVWCSKDGTQPLPWCTMTSGGLKRILCSGIRPENIRTGERPC